MLCAAVVGRGGCRLTAFEPLNGGSSYFILDSHPAPSPKPNRTFQYKRKNRRASRASFFLIGLRQVKVVRDDACLTYNYSMIKTGGCTVFDDSS